MLVNLSNYHMPVDQKFPGTYAYSPAPVIMDCRADNNKVLYRQDDIQAAARNAFQCDESNNEGGTSSEAVNKRTYNSYLMELLKARMGPIVELAHRIESFYQEKEYCPRFFSCMSV